ncbi:transcriptional regulator, IclR family [Asanoa ishikariensis]|uniref:Transcriptional regulator, IclR family n=1 Tax=Asanoa ishikariensis TaxID=137265 RepID=A0A1H3TLY0_9ACTN|nr:IclR family transcriptional regulator [Asanoa ishikariensis]SDZ51254.1 transcriptional regulator, IclR family [Asanoa ishikariensis]
MRENESAESVVLRALRLLAVLSEHGETRLAQLAAESGLPTSTAHRLLAALEGSGHVVRPAGPGHRPYLPGPALFELSGARDRAEGELVRRSEPYLAALAEELGETVHVAVLHNGRTRFLAGQESTRSLRAGLRLGIEHPATLSSTGRAILAELSRDNLVRCLGPAAAADPELDLVLEETRERGYAVNIGGVEPDITAIGAAVVDPFGRVRGALAVAGPATRLPESTLPWIGPILVKAAADLGAELGS